VGREWKEEKRGGERRRGIGREGRGGEGEGRGRGPPFIDPRYAPARLYCYLLVTAA